MRKIRGRYGWVMVLGVCLSLTSAEGSIALASVKESSREIAIHRTYGDHVHISSTAPPTVSAHGWWKFEPGFGPNGPPTAFMGNSSTAGVLADVTVQLQINANGNWVDAGPPARKRLRPGGGSTSRANARFVCKNTAKHQWRSLVDADLVGHNDTPEQLVTDPKLLDCGT